MSSSRFHKRTWRRGLLIFCLLLLAAGAMYLYLQRPFRQEPRAVRYPEFGIAIPQGYAIHGIDVSRYQSVIHWREVKAMRVRGVQMRFAFIKATEGTGQTDPYFERNWKRAGQAGMIRGAYHFFIPSRDGKLQAAHFMAKVRLAKGDLPPVLDIEQANGVPSGRLRTEALRWLQEVERSCGQRPILYTNVDFYRQYLGPAFDRYPLWVAHYYQPSQPRIGREWLFWQHSDRGRVNGIRHPVDFNVFNGDSTDLEQIRLR